MHLNSLKSKVVDQRIRQSLGGKEREIYFRLLKKMPSESIMLSIGIKFRENDAIKELSAENISSTCHDAKESTVNAQRKIGAGLDILTAVRDSGANPRMMYRMIFEHAPGIWKPINSGKAVLDWPGIKFIHSTLGAGFVDLDNDRISLKWLSELRLKQRYASEWEKIDPILTLLESPEGRLLVEHLHQCRANPCRCAEGKERLNHLIKSATRWHCQLERDFEICDTLIKESNDDVKFRFVKAVADVYTALMEIEMNEETEQKAPAPEKGKPDTSSSSSR